ncbi:protein of unknown function [Burkholderia multivorans]
MFIYSALRLAFTDRISRLDNAHMVD